MKKLFIMSVFILGAFATKAQVGVGIYGGVNLSNITYNNGSIEDASGSVAGYHFGMVLDLGLAKVLSIQTGLNLSQRGGRKIYSTGNNVYEYAYKPTYIDIPVLLNVKIPLGDFALHLAGGPYFSYGVAGSRDATFNSVTITQKIDWDDIKRTDMGLRLQARLMVGKALFVGAYYDQGLSNIAEDKDYAINNRNQFESFQNRNFGLSVGIMFNQAD